MSKAGKDIKFDYVEWNQLKQTGWNLKGKLFYAKAMKCEKDTA